MSGVNGVEVGVVTGLNLFPFKACHTATVDGQAPTQLAVGPTGFEAYGVSDRDYVIVDEAEMAPVTQRSWGDPSVSKAVKHAGDSQLAVVGVDIRPDHLLLHAPSHGELKVNTGLADGE